jgi:hypothetical protein
MNRFKGVLYVTVGVSELLEFMHHIFFFSRARHFGTRSLSVLRWKGEQVSTKLSP